MCEVASEPVLYIFIILLKLFFTLSKLNVMDGQGSLDVEDSNSLFRRKTIQ